MEWQTVIGLEVHVQLKTNSKLFSGAAIAYGAKANTQACAIDLGMPGVLPVLNKAVVNMAIKLGLALSSEIAPHSTFARKNYFYPDLPKGYQISQYEEPIIKGGCLEIDTPQGLKKINITRGHLEEDAGKSIHSQYQDMTGIDLNRAGTPLIEVVCEPELSNAKEAVSYLKSLHALVCALDICDGNMQEGSFRCDANVSVRPKGETQLGTRTEIKNINSFKFVEKAIDYEVERQIALIEAGNQVIQETRLFDPIKNQTRSMRSKEEANDYRYFPDPDLLPLIITQEDIGIIKKNMSELPQAKIQRFMKDYGLNDETAKILIYEPGLAHFYETLCKKSKASPQMIANWLVTEFISSLRKSNETMASCPVAANDLATLFDRIADNTVSGNIAKSLFQDLWQGQSDVDGLIKEKGLKQVSDVSAIEQVIQEIIVANPKQVEQYKNGKEKVFGFFVGQVMKAMQGKANPTVVNEILKKHLSA